MKRLLSVLIVSVNDPIVVVDIARYWWYHSLSVIILDISDKTVIIFNSDNVDIMSYIIFIPCYYLFHNLKWRWYVKKLLGKNITATTICLNGKCEDKYSVLVYYTV